MALALAAALAAAKPTAALVWLLGCGLGSVLVRFRFGFSSGFRQLLQRGDPRAAYAQLLLLALLVLSMAFALAIGPGLGFEAKLLHTPLTLPFLAGAFLFGVGMEQAKGCACGTLASTSQGGPGVILALAGLGLGAFLGTLHRPLLAALPQPRLEPPPLIEVVGLSGAVLVQLAVVVGLALLLTLWTGQAPWSVGRLAGERSETRRLYLAALWLALLASALLLLTAEPWKVLWGLALTAAHMAQSLGWDSHSSPFWGTAKAQVLLASPRAWLFNDAVLVDLGLVFGALATGWAEGRFRLAGAMPLGLEEGLRRGLGGVLMGYGGLLASGCNVNAFLGGVMSFSLHGWIWLVAALLGFAVSLRWCSPARRSVPGG